MKHLRFSRLQLIAATAIGLAAPILFTSTAHAADGRFYLKPDKITVEKNQIFTLQVRVDTQDNKINYASPVIRWPANKLEYGGQSSIKDSDFTGGSPGGLSGDYVSASFDRSKAGGVTGDLLVGTITFKALVDSGTINIGFDSQSSAGYSVYVGTDHEAGAKNVYFKFAGSNTAVSFTPDPREPKPPAPGRKENGELPEVAASNAASQQATEPIVANDDASSSKIEDTGEQANDKAASVISESASRKGAWIVGSILTLAIIAAATVLLLRRRKAKGVSSSTSPGKAKSSTISDTTDSKVGDASESGKTD